MNSDPPKKKKKKPRKKTAKKKPVKMKMQTPDDMKMKKLKKKYDLEAVATSNPPKQDLHARIARLEARNELGL